MAKNNKVQTHFAATVTHITGVATYLWQSGEATGTITDAGVGNITLNLSANQGVDAAECACVCSSIEVGATWPRRVMHSVTHTSDVAKQIITTQEGAAGAVSAAADIGFAIWIVKNEIL